MTALDFDLDEVTLPVKVSARNGRHARSDRAGSTHWLSRLASAAFVELPDVGHLHTPDRVVRVAADLTRTA